MSNEVSKNLPSPTAETAAYWQGCKEHQLLIQSCTDCGHVQFYPRSICTKCMCDTLDWIQTSGQATVMSYTIMHRPVSKAYGIDGPQILVLVRLDEGPQMMSHVVECSEEKISIGMTVEVVFEDWTDDISMPVFRPLKSDLA